MYYHLYFLDRFRRLGGLKFTDDEQKHFDQFSKKYPHSQELNEITAKWKLL